MPDYVTLTCPSCGGKLQINNDVERFACGYCGSEHVVKRGGGVVSLAPVIDEIKKVKIGVDKTASELAIARLTTEIEKLERMEKEIQAIAYKYDRKKYDGMAVGGVAFMERGIAHIFVEYDKKSPSKLLKAWNGTGFNDEEIRARLYSLTIEDTIDLQEHFAKWHLHAPHMTEDGKAEIQELVEDMEKIRGMLKARVTLPSKREELKKHYQIVNQ